METLTSGPGMVVAVKDFNDILIDFCKQTIKDQEVQFRSHHETAFLKETHFREVIYEQDQKLKTLRHRINNMSANL